MMRRLREQGPCVTASSDLRLAALTRREVALAAAAMTLMPSVSAGQQVRTSLPRVGVLLPGGPGAVHTAFVQSLAGLGHVDGQTLRIESRFARNQLDQLPGLATELVTLGVDVLVAIGATTARAAARATTKIPVVVVVVVDPVPSLVTDAKRPGGNLTGATTFDPEQPRTQIRLLKETLPAIARLAIIADAGTSGVLSELNRVAAEAEGLRPQIIRLRGPTPDFDAAFAAMKDERADAALGLEEPILFAHGRRIAEMAAAARLPTMFVRDLAENGPLLAYGTSLVAAAQHTAGIVDRILKGAQPGDMAIDVIKRPELVVNRRVARAIGVTIPPAVLARAANVVE
jgi:putative tryptophan/tyrosine transport system substrate-binding protein